MAEMTEIKEEWKHYTIGTIDLGKTILYREDGLAIIKTENEEQLKQQILEWKENSEKSCSRCYKSDKLRYFENGESLICDRCNYGQMINELLTKSDIIIKLQQQVKKLEDKYRNCCDDRMILTKQVKQLQEELENLDKQFEFKQIEILEQSGIIRELKSQLEKYQKGEQK